MPSFYSAIVLMLIGCWANFVFGAQVESVRLWRAPDNTRIVFDLSGPVDYKLSQLTSPSRIVIDIDNTDVPNSPTNLALAGSPVVQVRYVSGDKHGLRVVLDLNTEIKPRSFLLARHGDKPDRLVIDLFDNKDDKPPKDPSEPILKPLPQAQTTANFADEKRDIVIAVDAGHGGEDPGAAGPGAIREKVVVLDISKRLVELINLQKGYSARLVRTGDYYIPLYDRRDKARAMRADLFISVHADAFKNPNASGASVFTLSQRGATSESARFLASKENEADLIGGVGGVNLNQVDDVLAGVLVDLSMTATLSNSLDVGDRVLQEMGKITHLHRRHVEQAGFVVLKSPDVPSILVETGFISNPQEAKKLNTSTYRSALAAAIFKGVNLYFNDAPPVGSYVAWARANGSSIPSNTQKSDSNRNLPAAPPAAQAQPTSRPIARASLPSKPIPPLSSMRNQKHLIARGDTLADIARRYNISLRRLLEHNGLTSEAVIKVGQKLDIPAG